MWICSAINSKRTTIYWLLGFVAGLILTVHLVGRERRIPRMVMTGGQRPSAPSGIHLLQDGRVAVNIPECDCTKTVNTTLAKIKSLPLSMTTCSEAAFVLGGGQRVAAFTYYEDKTYDTKYKRDYFSGLEANLRALRQFRYIPKDGGNPIRLRLYYHLPSGSPTLQRLCTLACHEPDLDVCDMTRNPQYGDASILYPLMWRFLPVIDAQVELLLSRDLDSLMAEREAAALQQFLDNPDAKVHVMRDHPKHDRGMLGGTWAAKLDDNTTRLLWRSTFQEIVRDPMAYEPGTKKGPDQEILQKYVYPWAHMLTLSHDSYHCGKFHGLDLAVHPFPTRREDKNCNFVGAPCVKELKNIIRMADKKFACPVECRKEPEWTFC